MSARVTLDPTVWSEIRFGFLAVRLGIDKFSVIGRCSRLWAECTHRNEYTLTKKEIDYLSEYTGFTEALVAEKLAQKAHPSGLDFAGHRAGHGLDKPSDPSGLDEKYYLCGTQGRIEWLSEYRRIASNGGKKRSDGAKRDSRGRFLPRPSASKRAGQKPSEVPSSPPLHSISINTGTVKRIPRSEKSAFQKLPKEEQIRLAKQRDFEKSSESARSGAPLEGAPTRSKEGVIS